MSAHLPLSDVGSTNYERVMGHGCEYCQARAGLPAGSQNEIKASLAVACAEACAHDHREISPAQVRVMREHCSDPELVEPAALIAFVWAGGTFGKVLGIEPQQAAEPASGDSA